MKSIKKPCAAKRCRSGLKKIVYPVLLSFLFLSIPFFICAQNAGIGILAPEGKLHIKGSADIPQLIIDANSAQSNINPLIKLRKSDGTELMWINSDNINNTFIGLNDGRVNNAGGGGTNNSFIGSSAGYSNTNGNNNTAIGTNTLYSNTKASLNTAVGANALFTQSYGPTVSWESSNVAIGYEALYLNQPTSTSNGNNNTAVGTRALRSNITGLNNIGIGSGALRYNTTGSNNTAIGLNALNTNTLGLVNVANGFSALFSNTTASYNIAIGGSALVNQSFSNGGVAWSSNNVAVGFEALFSNQPTSTTNGINNTATGNQAMRTNTTGSDNTANGSGALYFNTTGASNTANGRNTLYSNTTGYHNTASGDNTLYFNTTGSDNTASGYKALYSNTTGVQNMANGTLTLYTNTTGSFNTASGDLSLYGNTTGSNNTATGTFALEYNTGGSNNTAIGNSSGTAPGTPNIINTVSVGNNGYLNAASNQAFIGNLSTNWCGGNTTWFTYASDGRVKNNVIEDVQGLEFIKRLRPVTYHLNITAMRTITGNAETPDYPEKYDVEKIKQSGFIAQEVEQAAIQSGYSFSGVTIPRNENELYTMSYSQFVVPLVKAMQEQQVMIEQLKTTNQELLRRLEVLEKKNPQ